jgi:4-amino-4-deoxy-L-arabinose transferase-like glycosyltransferase
MKSASWLLLAALVIGTAVRLFFIILPSTSLNTKALEPIADAPEYLRLADNLVRHRVFSLDTGPRFRPDVFRTPVYPMFLAGFSHVFSNPILPALVGQLLISLVLVWTTYALTRELGTDNKTASTAALLVAMSPNLAFLTSKLVTETLFTLLLVLTVMLLNRFRLAGRAQELVGVGVLSGLLILTRPIATFFPLVVSAYLFCLSLKRRTVPFSSSLIPLAAASIVVLPWVVRNGQATGRYVISTVSERNLYLYWAAAVLASEQNISLAAARDSMMAEAENEFGPLDSADEAALWGQLSLVGWRHLRSSPARTLAVHLVGCAAAWTLPLSIRPLLVHSGAATNTDFAPTPHLGQQAIWLLGQLRFGAALSLVWRERLSRMPPFARLVLIWAGLFHLGLMLSLVISLLVRPNRGLLWLLLPVLYFTLSVGPVGDARFRAPIEPFLVVVACAGLASVLNPRPARPT